MDISKLDEYQGLDAQMVRDWLAKHDATLVGDVWKHQQALWDYRDDGLLWSHTLTQIAFDMGYRYNIQSLLREINPRMRKGWPSEAAVQTHARWLAKSGPTGHIICGMMEIDPAFGPCLKSRTARLDKVRADDWFFWPCDANGNKTRWPVDTEGNML